MITFDLSFEWPMIVRTAEGRNDIQKSKGVKNRRVGGDYDLVNNITGVKGEFAVCKFFGIGFRQPMELIWSGSGNPCDLVINGRTYEVKTNTYHYGDLYLNPRIHIKQQKSDRYILCTDNKCGFPHIVDIVGWLENAEFKKLAVKKDFGHGPVMAVSQKDLRMIEELRG